MGSFVRPCHTITATGGGGLRRKKIAARLWEK